MDLKIYKSKSIPNLEDFENKLNKLNFYMCEKEEVGLFNFNKIGNNAYHIIFYIKEEYHTGTKYVSTLNKIPMDIYINTFLMIDKSYLLVEKLYSEYFNLIIDKYKELFNIECDPIVFENSYFLNLVNKKVRKVLHCDLDIDDYTETVENKESLLHKVYDGCIVDFITFTLESEILKKESNELLEEAENFSEIITSINRKGVITSKATTPMMLLGILQTVLGE